MTVSLAVRGVVSLVEKVSAPDATKNIEVLIEGAERPAQQQMKSRDPFRPFKGEFLLHNSAFIKVLFRFLYRVKEAQEVHY